MDYGLTSPWKDLPVCVVVDPPLAVSERNAGLCSLLPGRYYTACLARRVQHADGARYEDHAADTTLLQKRQLGKFNVDEKRELPTYVTTNNNKFGRFTPVDSEPFRDLKKSQIPAQKIPQKTC